MEAKILSTIGLVLGMGGAIPIAIQLAGEERAGSWIATVLGHWPDTLRRKDVQRSIVVVPLVVTALAMGVVFALIDVVPGPAWVELPVVMLGGGVSGAVLGPTVLISVRLLSALAGRLRSPCHSISTLVWAASFAILTAFGCQIAAVWLARV